MNIRCCTFPFLAILLLLAGCNAPELKPIPDVPAIAPDAEAPAGEAVLLLTEEAADRFDASARPASLDAIGVQRLERVFPDAGEFEARHRAAGLHRWYRVTYDPTVSPTKAGDDLSALPGVQSVSFPHRKGLRGSFNDPHRGYQWHYINTGQRYGYKAGSDINVAPVWENYTGGKQDVIVAVIDEGIDYEHEDLAGVVLSAEEGSRNFVYGYSDTDLLKGEHGTHVGGTIAAINNNDTGVCGVAGGLDGQGGVRLMACAIFGPKETDYGDEAGALVWAADHGAVIANCSWGFVSDTEKEAAQISEEFLTTDSATKSAIDYFIDHAGLDAEGNQTGPMAGGVVFFASGNDGFRYGPPAEYERVVAVGAFDPQGRLTRFSNYGPWLDLIAPGGTDSYYHPNDEILSTTPNNGYEFFSGTSMAAPHASGVAALIVSYFGREGFTNEMLKEAMLSGSVKGFLDLQDRETADGKLDALGAFNYLLGIEEDDPGKITFYADPADEWELKSHETAEMHVRIAGNAKTRWPVSVDSDCAGVTYNNTTSNVVLHIDALKAEPGTYSITVKVGDDAKASYPLTILPNHAPQVIRTMDDQVVNAASAAAVVLELDQYFEDQDGELPTYKIDLAGDDIVTADINAAGRLTLQPDGYGLATVTVTAQDARKTSASFSFQMLGRNQYRAMDIFPNPVTDWLHVRPGTNMKVLVELYDRLGNCVFESGSVTAGPFQPVDIDMREMAGGVYTLYVNGEATSIAKK